MVYFCSCFNALAEETGNILGNSVQDWSGSVTQCSSSSCWGGLQGGYNPSFSEDGTIRWGYGGGTLEQNIAIASILASNTGISVEGYRYAWTVKNADANYESSNGRSISDPLIITVEFYDNNNQVVESRQYDYSYHIDNWTWFSGTEWFKSPYLADELNSVSLFAYGDDVGYWAGWYGPEFGQYSINLIYSVDACMSDPLSSTDCPGYAEAYLNMMCTADALYDPTCSGYAEAYALANIVSPSSSDSNDGTDDGSNVDTGSGAIANDGSVDETSIASAGIDDSATSDTNVTDITPIEQTQNATDSNSGASVTDITLTEQTQQTQSAPVETATASEAVKEVAEVVEKEDPQQAQLEQANSMDLTKMSPSQVLGVLQSLGIVGNEMTNGVGDPTGLSDPNDPTATASGDPTNPSGSPLPSVVANSISQSSSAMTGSDDGTTANDDGSYSSTESSVEITSAAQLPNGGVPDSMSQSDFGPQADGSYSMLAEIDGMVYQIVVEAPEQSQNPSATGGDPTRDLQSVFGGIEIIADNTKVGVMAEEQNQVHESFAKRMLRDRIRNINVERLADSGDQGVGDEKIVQEITEESYAETDALSESDVSQSEVVASMNTNEEFEAYTQQTIQEVSFYADREIPDATIPNSKRGLRNGLAQQLLWDKMVEQQYKK